MENSNLPPRRTLSTSRLVLFLVLLLCFITSAVAGAMFAISTSGFDNKRKVPVTQLERERQNTSEELIKGTDKATIMIMGVDIRHDDVGRSDTLMVATVDPKYDQASLLSIPRDTRVRISGYGFDKINAAYAYGGEPLTEKTVENFLGIDIDHYIIVNVHSFVKIIDAIGGIDIYVPKRMYYEDPWDDDGGLVIDLYPGLQHMDGKTAVTYVRYRDSEGDIGRVHRQQQFMEACMDKVTSPEIIPRIPEIIREVMYAVDTDMTFRELLELAGTIKAAQKNGLVTDMVPGYPLYIDEISYWIPDVEEIRYAMALGLGVSFDANLRTRTQRVASEYNDSIPDNAVEPPEGAENIGQPSHRTRRYDERDEYNSRRDYVSDNRENSDSDSRRDSVNDSRENATSPRTDEKPSENIRRDYPRDYYPEDENIVPRRIYDDNNSSNDRTNSDSRVYNEPSNYDSRQDSVNDSREVTVDAPFDVPSPTDSEKTRN